MKTKKTDAAFAFAEQFFNSDHGGRQVTRGELIEEIALKQRLTKRTTGIIVDVVLDEVLAIVEPFALNQWGGDVLLRRLRALR